MKDIVQFIARFWFLILVGGLFIALLWMAAFA
jgi:cbb3-type cytochrome oxidase subunit 3